MEDEDVTVVDLRDAPVVIELESLGSHDSVLTALAQRYERQGLTTHQLWLGDLPTGESTLFDLAVPEHRLLLDVETVDTLISLDAHRYEPWRKAGYEIWVIAPQDKLDLVKRRLKGKVSHVQGGSMHGPQVKFEQPIDA